ncbi:hypothetical protein GIB67_042220 [Kingdonia uniflora]|uniref:GRF-type domain-containing protein n=1 Tax=Kingdonia uniflora TaxID=39325 RepID=A0A7J7LDV0_9MAGN|nr:hypothetical protein GIB67_042220 [Kingdonia uniflora]
MKEAKNQLYPYSQNPEMSQNSDSLHCTTLVSRPTRTLLLEDIPSSVFSPYNIPLPYFIFRGLLAVSPNNMMLHDQNMVECCPLCDQGSHSVESCPWVYSKCRKPNCNGIMKLCVSKTTKNPNRKFLACQYSTCAGFQWLSEAIGIQTKSSTSSFEGGCFGCTGTEHWWNHCPWRSVICEKKGCGTPMKLCTSRTQSSKGKKFLKCQNILCGKFIWLEDAIEAATNNNVGTKDKVHMKVKINILGLIIGVLLVEVVVTWGIGFFGLVLLVLHTNFFEYSLWLQRYGEEQRGHASIDDTGILDGQRVGDNPVYWAIDKGFRDRPIVKEQIVDIKSVSEVNAEYARVFTKFRGRNWTKILTPSGKVYPRIVRLFYATLQLEHVCTLYSQTFSVTRDSIYAILGFRPSQYAEVPRCIWPASYYSWPAATSEGEFEEDGVLILLALPDMVIDITTQHRIYTESGIVSRKMLDDESRLVHNIAITDIIP